MARQPQPRSNPTQAALSWLKSVVTDERFSIAMTEVNKRRKYQATDKQPEAHQQIFAAGYTAGFQDHLNQMIESAGQSTETFDSTQIIEQVQSRNDSYPS